MECHKKNSACSGNMSLFTISVCYKAYLLILPEVSYHYHPFNLILHKLISKIGHFNCLFKKSPNIICLKPFKGHLACIKSIIINHCTPSLLTILALFFFQIRLSMHKKAICIMHSILSRTVFCYEK